MDKARQHGAVTIQGGFSGARAPRFTDDLGEASDRRSIIERLVHRKLLAPGVGFNTFVVRGV